MTYLLPFLAVFSVICIVCVGYSSITLENDIYTPLQEVEGIYWINHNRLSAHHPWIQTWLAKYSMSFIATFSKTFAFRF